MKSRLFLGLFLLICIVLWVINNFFIGFTGNSISDFLLSKDKDIQYSPGDSGIPSEEENPGGQGNALGCIDSDGGKNFFELGTTSGYDIHGDFYVINDYCDQNNLIEYFCSNLSIMYVIYGCDYGCSEGVCLNFSSSNNHSSEDHDDPCVDLDGGLNYFVASSCTDSSGVYEDTCAIGGANGWFLKEAYCDKSFCSFINSNILSIPSFSSSINLL